MTTEEWSELARTVNADIAGLTRASLTQSGVRKAIQQRKQDPTEEQFIDEESFGQSPAAPRIFRVDGTEIRVWKTHRAGLGFTDIKGADLYYEIADHTYVLVQYKSPSRRKRITLDDEQLSELQEACPTSCPPPNRFNCGGWYAIRKKDSSSYFPGCEARNLFRDYKSRDLSYFVNGLTQDQFHKEFGYGRIGARTQPIDIASYTAFSIEQDRVIVSAVRK